MGPIDCTALLAPPPAFLTAFNVIYFVSGWAVDIDKYCDMIANFISQ